MSHYEIKYDTTDPKHLTKAIRDIQNFIGKGKRWERFVIIMGAAIGAGQTMPQIRQLCSFSGIEGFPVYAICKYITDILGMDMPEDTTEGECKPSTITTPVKANE